MDRSGFVRGLLSPAEPYGSPETQPARMNPAIARRGATAGLLMSAPESVMDERYPAWKKAQDQADQFLIASNIALSAAPFVAPLFSAAGRNQIFANLTAPSPINAASRGQAGMIRTPQGRIPETRAERIKLAESLMGRAKAAGYDVSEDVARTGTRYVNVTSPDGLKTAKIRFGDHDANMRRMAGGESFSIDPGTGGTYEQALTFLQQSGLPVAARSTPTRRLPTMIETVRRLQAEGMRGPDAYAKATAMLHRGEIID